MSVFTTFARWHLARDGYGILQRAN